MSSVFNENLSANRRTKHKASPGWIAPESVASGVVVVVLKTVKHNGIANAILNSKWSIDLIAGSERETEVIRSTNDDDAVAGSQCST